LDTATWLRVLDEAAALGVLHVHFSGGEPLLRKDLVDLVRRAAERQLYSNLITSAVSLDAQRLAELQDAGLEHVQISFQDALPPTRIALPVTTVRMNASSWRRGLCASGLALTLNFVVHRQNAEQVPAMLAAGRSTGRRPNRIAHVQYYGWAL